MILIARMSWESKLMKVGERGVVLTAILIILSSSITQREAITPPHLFRLWWFLSFVEDGVEALIEPAPHTWVLWGRVVLQQAEQLHREPRRRHKVVGVVLKVRVAGRHYLLGGMPGWKVGYRKVHIRVIPSTTPQSHNSPYQNVVVSDTTILGGLMIILWH